MKHLGWEAFGRRQETPNLCLDLDRFESNLNHMAQSIAACHKSWRPHSKCHKSPEVARRQIQAGAIGVTCAKVSEAEIFAEAGIRDILIAHLPVGPARVERITNLCKSADVIVTLDHYAQAEPLAAACVQQGVTCRALVDVNIGMNRTGVTPGRDALELARAIDQMPGLKLAGVMGYEGHAMPLMEADAKARTIRESLEILHQSRDQFLQAGLCCDIVSAGGTGSLSYAAEAPGITELQSGGGIFGDPFYTRMPGVSGYQPALTVLTTIVSRPTLDRAVLDAGRKAINGEMHVPLVKQFPDARVIMHSAEHIVLELGPESRNLKIGDQVELIVGYADFTVPLHNEFLCFRDDRLDAIWPIVARGKLQ
ncbi:MAG: DSD1 family PLP-dependent enzyme [Planctomycetes bacterium]|nr:DSD1 family PLP-dependent enzyme [Planctomycetota bacterium]